MATSIQPLRFALRPAAVDRKVPDAAWWPRSRSLNDQLSDLFALWPEDQGRIMRVLYSPPDWDDHPRKVLVAGRLVKTGNFPRDDTHEIVLTLFDGQHRTITVIPPGTTREVATDLLERVSDRVPADPTGWDNEGGHL